MRSYSVFTVLCWLQLCIHRCPFTYAIEIVTPDIIPADILPKAPLDPEPVEPINPSPNDGGVTTGGDPLPAGDDPAKPGGIPSNPFAGSHDSPIANVPGASFEGKDPIPSSSDEEIGISEIGRQLVDLVDIILSAIPQPLTFTVIPQTTTSANSSSPSRTFVDIDPPITSWTQIPLPSGAQDCSLARDAYVNCSSPHNTNSLNFTTSNRTVQAGCLCNIDPGIDFNSYVDGCYSWAEAQNGRTNSSIFHSYATAIANATTLCAPCPSSQGCGATTWTPTATTVLGTPTNEAVRGKTTVRFSICWAVMAALWAAVC